MEWSPKQAAALDAVAAWFRKGFDEAPVFRVFGYAGTGKTTLARHFAEGAGKVLFAAYTGKAAHVLLRAGCPNASTIHSLIYVPADSVSLAVRDLRQRRDAIEAEVLAEMRAENGGEAIPEDVLEQAVAAHPEVAVIDRRIAQEGSGRKVRFELNVESDLKDADLLVVDEVSMVDERVAMDLLSFRKKILVLGDPAQLPPVMGSGWFIDHEPDVLLTEIHRQARDNPIIDMATRVRMGEDLRLGQYGESAVIPWAEATWDRCVGKADQVIVGRNATRHQFNARFRELSGRGSSAMPVRGDKVICLRNDRESGLLNGSLWRVLKAVDDGAFLGLEVVPQEAPADVESGMGVVAHREYFLGKEPSPYMVRDAQCFAFGYAITCHKSQGSQWDDVVVFDESPAFRQDARRWQYTAITRAAKRVVVAVR